MVQPIQKETEGRKKAHVQIGKAIKDMDEVFDHFETARDALLLERRQSYRARPAARGPHLVVERAPLSHHRRRHRHLPHPPVLPAVRQANATRDMVRGNGVQTKSYGKYLEQLDLVQTSLTYFRTHASYKCGEEARVELEELYNHGIEKCVFGPGPAPPPVQWQAGCAPAIALLSSRRAPGRVLMPWVREQSTRVRPKPIPAQVPRGVQPRP